MSKYDQVVPLLPQGQCTVTRKVSHWGNIPTHSTLIFNIDGQRVLLHLYQGDKCRNYRRKFEALCSAFHHQNHLSLEYRYTPHYLSVAYLSATLIVWESWSELLLPCLQNHFFSDREEGKKISRKKMHTFITPLPTYSHAEVNNHDYNL